jgi:hypothetical protein
MRYDRAQHLDRRPNYVLAATWPWAISTPHTAYNQRLARKNGYVATHSSAADRAHMPMSVATRGRTP